MTGEMVRIVVVGGGRMGRVHLRAARSSSVVKPVAVVDPQLTTDARAAFAGLDIFERLDAALDQRGFDAAIVAAPSALHRSIVDRLLTEGIPTLCEKPLGLTVADASAIADLAEGSSVPLQVGYWRRFVPALVELRDRLAAGTFGEVSLIEAWQWDREPPSAEFRRHSGGIVRDMGVHEIDQIRWLTGQELDVASVVAADVTTTDPVDGDPESVAMLARLSGGGLGYVSLGRRHVDGDACWVEVIGTLDAARVDFMYGSHADVAFDDAIVAQLDAFADRVRGRASPNAATPADAVAALRVLEAVEAVDDVSRETAR